VKFVAVPTMLDPGPVSAPVVAWIVKFDATPTMIAPAPTSAPVVACVVNDAEATIGIGTSLSDPATIDPSHPVVVPLNASH
jgi:hypothetical protein